MSTRPLDRLSAESRAVLSLILLQSRSYADIAALLRLGEDDVRDRAHSAARQLVESGEQPDPVTQAQIIDYLLGEQTASERARTRSTLAEDPVAQAWAAQLVDGLSPLADEKLPAIPGPPADSPEPPATEPETPATAPEPPAARGRTPRWTLVPLLGLLVVAVIVVVALTSGGGGRSPSTSHAKATQLVFSPAAVGGSAGGSATVERRAGGLLLEIRAHGLPANTQSDSYGVWLDNSKSDALLLGFVSPAVGSSGAFENGVTLPADAGRYRALIVTVETVSEPSSPGTVVLRAPFSVP